MCKSFHISMVKHCNFVCYYLVKNDEDFDRGEVLLQGLQLDGDLEEGFTLKTKLSDVMSKANANPSSSIIFQIHCL